MAIKMTQVFDGEWIRPHPQEGHKMACCDCGLVHTFDFRVVTIDDGKGAKQYAVYRAVRDKRATSARRKRAQKKSA